MYVIRCYQSRLSLKKFKRSEEYYGNNAGNNVIKKDREDKFVVCELDIDWQKHSIEELARLCEDYCKQLEKGESNND